MLTMVFPEDLCAAEISIRFMAALPAKLVCDVWLVLRHEVQHTHADGGDNECDRETAKAQQNFVQRRMVGGDLPISKGAADLVAREYVQRESLTANDKHVQQCKRPQDHQHRSRHDALGLAHTWTVDQQQWQQVANHDIAPPEQTREYATVAQDEMLEILLMSEVQIHQMVCCNHVEGTDYEDAKQVLFAPQNLGINSFFVPSVNHCLNHVEHGQPPCKRQHDEHRWQQGRTVCLTSSKECENQAGTGGKYKAPSENSQASHFREWIHASFHHRPQIDCCQRKHAGIQHNVPRKHRGRVVIGCRDHEPIRPAQIQHENGETARQHGDGKQTCQRRTCLVYSFTEYRSDRSNVKHTRG